MFLKYLSPILDASGYASAARGYLYACDSVGIIVQAKDRSRSLNLHGKGLDEDILSMYSRLQTNLVPQDAPCIQHTVPDIFFTNSKTKYSIGYTIFEMTSIPKEWAPHTNKMDVIWTGSEYSKQAFITGGTTVPIHVLPHALNMQRFSPEISPWPIKNKRSFNFISVFDFTDRKAWKELLRAYWTAFKSTDDVAMILKIFYGGFDEDSQKDLLRRILSYKKDLGFSSETAPLLIYGHDIPMKDMAGLYRSADCYVSISREGFGLPYCEAMACGLACIGPEVGGTRQFMTSDNSFLIKYEKDEVVSNDILKTDPLFAGLTWAKHSWEHLAETMKKVASDNELRKTRAKIGTEEVRSKLNYEAIGKRIIELLNLH